MRPPELCDPRDLPGASVLAIAPHPDDESLGCGGLLACLAAQGRAIHVVFVTDGSASHTGSPTWPRARLAAQRETEACTALSRLGLGDQPRTFLRLRDSAMPTPGSATYRTACATLAAIVGALNPGLALLPWRRDPHCDHRAAWRLASEAIAAAGRPTTILEYAVWLDELGGAGDAPRPGPARYGGWRSTSMAPWQPNVPPLRRTARRRAT